MEIKLIEMDLSHLPEVLSIEKVSFPTPWSQQAFIYEILQNNFSYYVVALDGAKVVGYGGMWLILDEAHITNIAVSPSSRGKKVGLMLMKHLMKKAVEFGAVRMTLEVRPSNDIARNLYKKLGFEERGLRKNYYNDTHEDAIIMWQDNLVTNEE
ncbi:ribosomal protein S18-alanine N-acetyltransferase [Peptococcaceae bacterium 1198_IL3148]